jgi:hypothetical protein
VDPPDDPVGGQPQENGRGRSPEKGMKGKIEGTIDVLRIGSGLYCPVCKRRASRVYITLKHIWTRMDYVFCKIDGFQHTNENGWHPRIRKGGRR